MLKERRKPGNIKGDAVRCMDVKKGPFSEIEFESLNISALNAFEDGRFDTKTFSLILLVLSHGARSVQLAHLKVKDIKRLTEVKYGSNYELSMPVVKDGEPPRQELRQFYLQNDFGALVYSYAQEVKQEFIGLLDDPDEAPLFPAEKRRESKYEDVEGLEHHMNPTALGNWISSAADSLGVVSERTGEAMNIFPTRFRRSFGTRLGAEGHPAAVIAHMMCHHDIQNVLVYTGATWEAIDRIDRAVGMMLAPLVQSFMGTIVLDESEAVRGDDPSSRIFDPRITDSTEVMGNCGKYSFCGFNAPIACYTCRQFQPWLDGPHEAVYDYLTSERERLLTTDKRIAKLLDRTILAVLEVIRRCTEITGEFPSQEADHAS
jgi:integrase